MAGMGKLLGKMAFNSSGGAINWFPGHMATATRAIRERLKLADLVVEVRDSRIPLSSANEDFQDVLSCKKRIIILNKRDLANSNITNKWTQHFDDHRQLCCFTNAHSKHDVRELLSQVETQLRDAISRHPTLLVIVVGIPNVGKSALINAMYRISRMRLAAQEKLKRATVGPLPGVTQDIAGFKIAHQPSIYVLDTPGVLVPNIPDIDTGLKLALTGAVKDSVVGEDRVAQYLLAMLNTRHVPLRWKGLNTESCEESSNFCPEDPTAKGPKDSLNEKKKKIKETKQNLHQKEDQTLEVQKALFRTFSAFKGNLENEDDLEDLIESQFKVLQKAFRIPPNSGESGRIKVSKKLLKLFRMGKLGHFILDSLPKGTSST